MINLFEKINIESRNAKFLYDGQKNQEIIVDNSFQRKYVWTLKHQVKLIETILMGFPIPEVYLWQRNTDPDTGETQFAIVDGQQRLGALTNYINNDFFLVKSNLDEENKDLFGGKKFKDLDPELKSKLWKYNFSVRFIDDSVDRETIVKLFLKLNSTEFTLNPQELRNAQFDGIFLNVAEEIANHPFWKKHSIFSDNQMRRMNDIQFISTLLIFLRKGIEEEYTQKNINQIYDSYNVIYAEKDDDIQIMNSVLNGIDDLMGSVGEKSNLYKYLKKQTHLYTIFNLIYFLYKKKLINHENFRKLADLLQNWFNAYDNNGSENWTELSDYKKANQDATLSKANRLQRFNILKRYVMEGLQLNVED